jgi:hypothetical protein
MRLAATTGTTLETAWPIIARRHIRLVSRSGSCGSAPIAVGKSNISAPSSISARAVSGYHWSQHTAGPTVPKGVGKVLKPVLPGRK